MTSEVEKETPIFSGRDLQSALAQASQHHEHPANLLKAEYVRGHTDSGVQIVVIEKSQENESELYREEVATVTEMLAGLMEALSLGCAIETEVGQHKLRINLVGADAEIFLEHRGELLNDLHFLVTRFFRSIYPSSILEIKCDANQYRQKREAGIDAVSREAAASLTEPGDHISLKPMNSYERRVVHLLFKDDPCIQTQSVGEGQLKSVQLTYQPDDGQAAAD